MLRLFVQRDDGALFSRNTGFANTNVRGFRVVFRQRVTLRRNDDDQIAIMLRRPKALNWLMVEETTQGVAAARMS